MVDAEAEQVDTAQERIQGTVKWFNVKAGYGFIKRSDNDQDVFVHQSAIIKNNPEKLQRSLAQNEPVEFIVRTSEKGDEAAQVTGPNGAAVQGSEYASSRQNFNPRGRGYGYGGPRDGFNPGWGQNRGYFQEVCCLGPVLLLAACVFVIMFFRFSSVEEDAVMDLVEVANAVDSVEGVEGLIVRLLPDFKMAKFFQTDNYYFFFYFSVGGNPSGEE